MSVMPQAVARRAVSARDPAAELAAPTPARHRFHFLTDVQIERQPPVAWLVHEMIPENSLAEMHAPPECAKTFLGLAIALSVGTGENLFGRAVKRGPVIYLSAEGSAGLGVRVAAWKHSHERFGPAGVYFLTEPVELLDSASVGGFLAAIDSLGLAERPRLIVLDTLARCLVGGEENSAKDLGLAIAAADHIRRATGATVLLLHHVRKDGESERGSTALRGSADTMLDLKRENDHIVVSCSKQKDAPHFAPIHLELVPVLDSCVLITAQNGSGVMDPLRMPETLQALRSLHDAAPLEEGLSTSKWLSVSGLKERTFYMRRKSLLLAGYVEYPTKKRGAPNLVTAKGRDAVAVNCNIAAG